MTRIDHLNQQASEHAFVAVVFFLIALSAGIFGVVAYLHQTGIGLAVAILIAILSTFAGLSRAAKCNWLSKVILHESLAQRGIWSMPPARSRFF